MDVYFSPLAVSDLEEIRDYLAERNPIAARQLLDQIDVTCERLGKFPRIGTARNDLLQGIRLFPVQQSYVVFYRIVAPFVEIVRVVHASRDFDLLFDLSD